MDKRSKFILTLLGLALLTIILVELFKPKPINWKDSYTSADKIPFGSYVLFNELKEIQGSDKITAVSKNPYDFLSNTEVSNKSAYLFINPEFNIDKRSYEKMIDYVEKGNSIFIAAHGFGTIFKDSLQIETTTDYQITETEIHPIFTSNTFSSSDSFTYKSRVYKTVFNAFDTLNTKVLGYYNSKNDSLEEINFIQIKKGKGNLYLNTLPEAFSNFYLLSENQKYASNALSYIQPLDQLYWDDYIKSGRRIIKSPMRFVLTQAPLKWSYYLLILGLILFVIFKAKREQRIIPVIKPLENTSIEFTKTVGDLYFQYKDYSDIIAKKITYFLEKIRSTHHISTNKLDKVFIEKLTAKTKNTPERTKELVDLIIQLRGRTVHTESDLLELNKKIEDFIL
ncbi:DUF4350 domain-containing protein [Aquimarina brevivitae]|uniref:Uncharacterized protein DUF4350 n=1 Tax=Aquimarina brevivitae TaxID=323412 RepID=A0A4Q7P0K5_9FLAO|nr:DUF4350 domain-containing protein [Aquimarina brevivitae]RZS93326.1 uncharacterized protein DUF4350 [Aquimarina brevivitae]